MQEADVLLVLAEIAGVFVGFGALIAVRSGGTSDASEVWSLRWVLTLGVWVIVVALAPVVLGSYDIGAREVWLVSGLVALAGWVVMAIGNWRTPEARQGVAAMSRAEIVRGSVVLWLLGLPMLGALILVVLGLFPDQDPALYLTAVVLGLFMAAWTLVALVFERRRPVAASSGVEQPAE